MKTGTLSLRHLLLTVSFMLTCYTGMAQSYFQQKVATNISVRLDDRKHMLRGFESFHYTNYSSDTLRYLYIHLWPNAYGSDRTRFAEQQVKNKNTTFYFSKAKDRGFIDSLEFHINDQPVSYFSDPGLPDIARIDLPTPLLPGASLDCSTPFRVKVPAVFSRMGHTGQAYYISQWFPKPAVYDLKGWHPLPYTDQGEFFSEIGSYDVQISVPDNYIVMATGNCQDEHENQWIDSLCALPYPEFKRPSHHLKRWRDSVNHIPKSSATWKTLHFHEDNIHDFAWFADKRFVMKKDTVQVPAGAGIEAHTVCIYSGALPSESCYWEKATSYMKKTVGFFSAELGPYPYKTVKAIEGDLKAGGGMEYPTVTVVDRLATYTSVMQTIVHEVGHNWFYGILANNERDHAWMDEGFNTFYEQKIERNITLPMGIKETYTNRIEDVLYYNAASTHSDQGLNNTSMDFSKSNYGLDVYYKAALMLNWLEAYMGVDSFRLAMQDYFNTWKFRHPYPEDVEAIFQKDQHKPVDWFFNGALKTDIGIDFAVKHASPRDGKTRIHVRNNSGFAAPVRINAYHHLIRIDSVWSRPFLKDTILTLSEDSATMWRESTQIPDYYGFNNRYHRYGLLHDKTFRVKAGLSLGNSAPAELYILPAIGYNIYDGLMAGVLFHNLTVPQNRFRFALAPLYGFRSKDFVGSGSMGYWTYPQQVFSEIVPQLDVKSFHFDSTSYHAASVLRARYIKLAPSISFVLKNPVFNSSVTRTILIKGYAIWENGFNFTLDPADSLYKPSKSGYTENNYGLLRYTHVNARTFNPFSYILEVQVGSRFSKLSAEGKLRIDYNLKGKGLNLRAYAGKFISLNHGEVDNSRYWLNSGYTGINDYLYDGTYIGRSEREGFGAQQVSIQEGGGKLTTPLYGFPLGMSDDWLIGFNFKSDLPFWNLPIRLYLDGSTYSNAAKVDPSGSRFLYSGGLELHAIRDILLIHFPLIMCQDYRDYLKSMYPDKQFAHSISFAIQFQNINWLRIISSGMRYYLN